MRLDLYLSEKNIVLSRTDAKKFICAGAVRVNGKVITKPSYDIECDDCTIEVDTSIKKYVSRGGLKLEAALDSFLISVEDKLALDVGASSGGFTDCLLKRGASEVIAVDSGTNQLVQSLRDDLRVTVMENFNARFLSNHDLKYVPEIAVMDVSFISAKLIIPAIFSVLASGGDFVCLVKPQFEVGRSAIGKNGIVKDEKARLDALGGVVDFGRNVGFSVLGTITSPIEGGDGNVEYLVHFRKE